MPFVLPVGINFADGVTLLPWQPSGSGGTPLVVGTPLPTADLTIWNSDGGDTWNVEEPPGSPVIERAEQCTCQHTLTMAWQDALNYWSVMGRGVIVNDSAANIWRILSCTVKRIEAGKGELTYSMESISFDSPPDDFQLNDVSLDLNIIKHPRYAWALNPYITDASTYSLVGAVKFYYQEQKEALIRMIQNYIDSPYFPNQASTQGLIQTNILSALGFTLGSTGITLPIHYPNSNYNPGVLTVDPVPWDGTGSQPTANCVYFSMGVDVDLTDPTNPLAIAVAAAQELITKLWRNEDTPYIPSWEIIWIQKFFAPIYLNPGSYTEDPRDFVPQYFISPFNNGIIPRGLQTSAFGVDTDAPPATNQSTIFDELTKINPQLYSTTGIYGGPLAMSSLRKSDSYQFDRTFFAVAHKWSVSCVGKWDSDLYTGKNRPQTANDYNVLPPSFGG